MLKQLTRISCVSLMIAALVAVMPMAALAAPPQQQAVSCEQVHTVQAGDWLSKVANDYYGNMFAYPAIVQATNSSDYQQISNPDMIEVGWQLCIPSQTQAQAMLDNMNQGQMTQDQMAQGQQNQGQMTQDQMAQGQMTQDQMDQEPMAQGPEYTAPEGQALLVLRNRSLEQAPSTITLSGGEFAGGEMFTINPGEELTLEVEPGDYRAIWSSPASDISFGRDFTLVAGQVATGRIVPEDGIVRTNFDQAQPQQGQDQAAQDQASRFGEFPYQAPEGQGLIVATNRSLEQLPSTLTISGGEFAGGEMFTINPGEETFLPVNPGEYTVQWSAPTLDPNEGQQMVVSRQFNISAGEAPFVWVVPEEERGFVQAQGEAPTEMTQ